jgi:hypothetical protein
MENETSWVVSGPACYVYQFLVFYCHRGFKQGGAKRTHVFEMGSIYLRFLSLRLPQIKTLRSKTSYSRRSEIFHSWRNCNCATRNVSKCDAELWGETRTCVRQEGRHLSDIIFRKSIINVSNLNRIYYRLFWC